MAALMYLIVHCLTPHVHVKYSHCTVATSHNSINSDCDVSSYVGSHAPRCCV